MNQQALSTAIKLHQAGRLAEAEAIYRQLLQRDPNNSHALHLLGVLLSATGQNHAALELMRRGLALDDTQADQHVNLGSVLAALDRQPEAIAAYRRAIQLQPDSAEAYNNLGLSLDAVGQSQDAIAAFRQAVQLRPKYPEGWANLGNALHKGAQSDEAITALSRALSLRPDFPEAIFNLANIFQEVGRFAESIAAYRRAISLRPDYFKAMTNLSNVLRACDQFDLSAEVCRQAIALRPNLLEAKMNLGSSLQAMGRVSQAIDLFRQASALPGAHSNLLLALHYSRDHSPKQMLNEHLMWNDLHAKPLELEIRPHDNDRSPDRRLKIGYVSCDFREHSVAYFLENLLTHHDRKLVASICYSDTTNHDAVTGRLRNAAHQWKNIAGLSDVDVAEMIRREKIDILVDLSGHTGGNRLLVFARKPAPVQVTYLGYPDTTGLSAMDYRLTDHCSDPQGQTDAYHSEELMRLPTGFLCYRPPEHAPAVNELPVLTSGKITFGSFNNLAKISELTIGLWSGILKQLLTSRLLIKSRGLTDGSAQKYLLEQFFKHGISSDRLEIRGRTPTLEDHLAQYHEIDIALDTFPYHGTATTCEALWMGVPVITLAGKTHVRRVGMSLLSMIEITELIATDELGYVNRAVNLAKDLDRLKMIRIQLRGKMLRSSLLDAAGHTRAIEAAYRRMWEKWVQNA